VSRFRSSTRRKAGNSGTRFWGNESRSLADWNLDAKRGTGPRDHGVSREPRLSGPLQGGRGMRGKRVIPAFKSESEEAEWWYKKRGGLDATLKAQLAASKSRVVSIRLPEGS
jgi:hypothetical protein